MNNVSHHIGRGLCSVHLYVYVMYTYCIGYAVSVVLCDSFVRCNRPCECL